MSDSVRPLRRSTGVEIWCLSGALLEGEWWVVWGDDAGNLRRANLTASLAVSGEDFARNAEIIVSIILYRAHVTRGESLCTSSGSQATADAPVRGCALEPVSRRAYWTAGSAVHVSALDGRARVTLHARAHSAPDDLVLHNATRQLFWSERGASPGVMAAGLDGASPRWLVHRRVRRVTALALDAWARRLYFVDGYYDTLESVRLDGGERVLHAQFTQRPPNAPLPIHVYVNGGERVTRTKVLAYPVRSRKIRNVRVLSQRCVTWATRRRPRWRTRRWCIRARACAWRCGRSGCGARARGAWRACRAAPPAACSRAFRRRVAHSPRWRCCTPSCSHPPVRLASRSTLSV